MRNTITKLITLTMAVAAIAVIGSSWTTQAQGGRLYVATDVGVFGYVPGQTARFSVAYPSTPEEGTEPVRVQVALYDAQGNEVARSREEEVPRGGFSIFDFKHEDLPLAGESDTRRVQVRAGLGIYRSHNSGYIDSIHVSAELVDNLTGATTGGTYYCGSVTVSED